MEKKTKGLTAAIAAFAAWGLFPIYWKMLGAVNPVTILSHRILWSLAFALVVIAVSRKKGLSSIFRDFKVFAGVLSTGLLISVNWLIYIYAVNAGFTVEASLGYYMNPLFSIFLGLVFLKEKLSKPQIVAIALAFAGVVIMAWGLGRFPWISIALMTTFGFYGLIKKKNALDPLVALAGETMMVSPLAIAAIALPFLFSDFTLSGRTPLDAMHVSLLVLGGPVTAIPLWLFAIGAKYVPLSSIGFCQFISPTLQLLVAVLLFGEPFGLNHGIAFGFIWAGLLLYALSYTKIFSRKNKEEIQS